MANPLQTDPIGIFYPNGMNEASQMYVWDTMNNQPILWDGAVTFSGSITIGAVTGNLTNNAVPPPAGEQLGVLPAIANAAAPSWTEGRQVLLSTDLSGALRVSATIDTTGLATSANQVTMINSLSVMDDWDETNRAAVNTIVGQVGIQGGAGVVTALTTRVAIATDANAVTVAAGSAVIGHVITDTGSTTVVTGNVTVVQGTGTNLHVVLDTTSTTAVTQATAANLNATVVGAGTAGTANAGVVTVQGIASMTKLLVTPDSVALPANQSVNVAQLNAHTTLEGGANGSLAIGGTVATNVAITANPINLGAQGVSSENSAITTARQVQLVADLVGKLIVLPYANPENFISGAITSAMTGTTSTSLIGSPGGSLRNYLTQITVSNAHATVGTDIIIQDGSGGTTLYTIPAAAVYGGATVTFPVPLRQPTTATAIFCANVTTGASTKVSASGYKGL